MKHSQTSTTFKPVALAAAILVTSMASTAFAEGAVDTAAEIAALKSELAQLRQLVNQNAGVQQTNATKLAKVEEKIATSFNEPTSTTGARPLPPVWAAWMCVSSDPSIPMWKIRTPALAWSIAWYPAAVAIASLVSMPRRISVMA